MSFNFKDLGITYGMLVKNCSTNSESTRLYGLDVASAVCTEWDETKLMTYLSGVINQRKESLPNYNNFLNSIYSSPQDTFTASTQGVSDNKVKTISETAGTNTENQVSTKLKKRNRCTNYSTK